MNVNIKLGLFAFLFFTLTTLQQVQAQDRWMPAPEVKAMYEEATKAMAAKDYEKAIQIYFQAVRVNPNDVVLRRDLAYAYYLNGQFDEGINILEEVVRANRADPETYQLLAAFEHAKGNERKSNQMIEQGIKKFPESGVLLYTKGSSLIKEGKKNKNALKYFMKGIKGAPLYANNYLAASKILLANEEPVWSAIYAEIFINLDPQSAKTIEAKKILVDAYRKLFTPPNNGTLPNLNNGIQLGKTTFEDAVYFFYNNNFMTLTDEFNVDNLTMLRTRFILDWSTQFSIHEHSLFQYYYDLIQGGVFEAYNQSLFGAVLDSKTYSTWVQKNGTMMKKLGVFQENKPYMPALNDPQFQ